MKNQYVILIGNTIRATKSNTNLPSKSPASSLWPLWSSETALRGSPRSLRRPNNLDASNDLCPGIYLARDRQNLHRPRFPGPECCCKFRRRRKNVVMFIMHSTTYYKMYKLSILVTFENTKSTFFKNLPY